MNVNQALITLWFLIHCIIKYIGYLKKCSYYTKNKLNSKHNRKNNKQVSKMISNISIIVSIISIIIHGSAPLKKQEILGMPTMY